MTEDEQCELIHKINALIALRVMELQASGKFSVGSIYSSLSAAGLSSTEIGEVVGRSGKDAAAVIATYKKNQAKKAKQSIGE